jgi:MFS family permease
VQGFATGAAFGVAGAYLFDLQPAGSRLGSLVNTALPVLGIGLGAILAGVLVQYGPYPTVLIFVILMALFALLAFSAALLPETVRRVAGAATTLRPRIAVPARARRAFAGAVPTMVSGWALNGLTLSVGASLLATVFRQSNHGIIGLVIGLFTLSAAAASVLERDLLPSIMARLGSAAIAVGALLFVFALAWSSVALFVLASIVGGGGFGTGYLGSIRSVSQLAELRERAGLISAVYVVSYLAFSIPALVAGVLATHIGLRHTSFGYGCLVALIAFSALTFARLNAGGNR